MANQVRAFVSHHHSPEEDTFTARLVNDLEAAGADVWVDMAGITPDDFVRKISEGLAGRQWRQRKAHHPSPSRRNRANL
jgi:hypothetical protein